MILIFISLCTLPEWLDPTNGSQPEWPSWSGGTIAQCWGIYWCTFEGVWWYMCLFSPLSTVWETQTAWFASIIAIAASPAHEILLIERVILCTPIVSTKFNVSPAWSHCPVCGK